MLNRKSTVGEFLFSTVSNMAKRELEIVPRLSDPSDRAAVHDFRVEIRRLRSILGSCETLLETEWFNNFRSQLKAIDEVISPVRNAQVLFDRFNNYPDVIVNNNEALYVSLQTMVSEAEATFTTKSQTPEFKEFLRVIKPADSGAIAVLDPDESIYKFLKSKNKEQWKSLRRAALKAHPNELHRVRIKAKKVRYLGEASIPILGSRIQGRAQTAQRIQTLLGELQDSTMMSELVTSADILEYEKEQVKQIRSEWSELVRRNFD